MLLDTLGPLTEPQAQTTSSTAASFPSGGSVRTWETRLKSHKTCEMQARQMPHPLQIWRAPSYLLRIFGAIKTPSTCANRMVTVTSHIYPAVIGVHTSIATARGSWCWCWEYLGEWSTLRLMIHPVRKENDKNNVWVFTSRYERDVCYIVICSLGEMGFSCCCCCRKSIYHRENKSGAGGQRPPAVSFVLVRWSLEWWAHEFDLGRCVLGDMRDEYLPDIAFP